MESKPDRKPAPPAAASENLYRGIITVCAMIATLMQVLDNTIANVALPRIQGSLSATQDQMAWGLTSYIVAAAIMTLGVEHGGQCADSPADDDRWAAELANRDADVGRVVPHPRLG